MSEHHHTQKEQELYKSSGQQKKTLSMGDGGPPSTACSTVNGRWQGLGDGLYLDVPALYRVLSVAAPVHPYHLVPSSQEDGTQKINGRLGEEKVRGGATGRADPRSPAGRRSHTCCPACRSLPRRLGRCRPPIPPGPKQPRRRCAKDEWEIGRGKGEGALEVQPAAGNHMLPKHAVLYLVVLVAVPAHPYHLVPSSQASIAGRHAKGQGEGARRQGGGVV